MGSVTADAITGNIVTTEPRVRSRLTWCESLTDGLELEKINFLR